MNTKQKIHHEDYEKYKVEDDYLELGSVEMTD